MKILHIISSYYPATRIGGPIQSVRGLNIELVKSGVSVDVITTNSGLIKEEIRLNEWVDDNGVAVKYLPYLFGRNYNFSLSLFFEIVGNLKKYDLVHITSVWNFPIVAGVISCYLKRKPYVISPRGVLYEEAINIKSKQIKKLYYFLLAQHYLKKASAMHFTSEHERDNVADFVSCSKDSFVVPNGVDLTQFKVLPEKGKFRNRFSIPNEKNIILFLGRLHKQKGVDILLNAFKMYASLDKNAFLVFVGDGDGKYVNQVKMSVKKNNLENKVLFTGWLDGKDKLSAFVDSNVFVLSSYFENFGMSVIEAMACGVPVIVSNKVGICSEVEKYNAGMVVELNPIALCESIQRVLFDKEYASGLSRNAFMLVNDRYDINKVASMMIREYEKILIRFKQ